MSALATRRLMCSWRIVDLDQTFAELRATAERDLPEMLYRRGVQAAGPPSWDVIAPSEDERPELIVSIPVTPWRDPARDRSRRATTPSEATR